MEGTIPNKVKSKPPHVRCGFLFISTQAPATCCVAQFSLKLMNPLPQPPSAGVNAGMSYCNLLVDVSQSPCVIHRTHQQAGRSQYEVPSQDIEIQSHFSNSQWPWPCDSS